MDKIFAAKKTFRLRRIKLRHRKKHFARIKQHRFPLEGFCSRRTKSFLARKSPVLAGQKFVLGNKLSFCRKEFRLPKKSFICFGRDVFSSNEILFGRKRFSNGPTKSFFLRTRFVWNGRDFFWREESCFHRKKLRLEQTKLLRDKQSSLLDKQISFLKNEFCLNEN
jgi:hypothetical protein